MSADNTIVILKLKGEWRVEHLQGFENLFWSHLSNEFENLFVPARVFEYFKDSKHFETADEAWDCARKMYGKMSIVEYGIQEIEYLKSWNKILELSREIVTEEKLAVLSRAKDATDVDLEKINQLVDELNYTYGDILKEIIKTKTGANYVV